MGRAAERLGVYGAAKTAYQHLVHRAEVTRRREACAFLRAFVPRGGLVFDIGANTGVMVERYLALGARVVAVEPTPELASRLERRYGGRRVAVERAAVGDREGMAMLHVCSQSSHSTLSDRRLEETHGGPEARALQYERDLETPVTTLDALIARHGTPAHLKVDVEGFEDSVFRGLSAPVATVSFEYHRSAADIAERVLERLDGLGAYEYNCTSAQCLAWDMEAWGDRSSVQEWLALDGTMGGRAMYGDVYARYVGGRGDQ